MKRKIFKFAAIAMMLATGFSCTQNLNIEPTLPELDTRAVLADDEPWDNYLSVINANNLNVTGNYIRVAVLDTGVDMEHPDLSAHIVDEGGYDAFEGIGGDKNGGPVYDGNHSSPHAHGTACAGIVVAVAPGSKLIPIRMSDGGRHAEDAQVAAAIDWAWEVAGADVISCSWDRFDVPALTKAALQRAMEAGRDSLGCVVVIAAGNGGSAEGIHGIAASDKRFLVVGAIENDGTRRNDSSWGDSLDVMAPGRNIPTTDIEGSDGDSTTDYRTFNQTSSATPQVAGVAALILQNYPDLSVEQVHDIITSTAQKTGGYSYTSNPVYPNGTWNEYMGYGVVNALAALGKADELLTLIGDENVPVGSTNTYSIAGRPDGATFNGLTITPSSYTKSVGTGGSPITITFNAIGKYTLRANFIGVSWPSYLGRSTAYYNVTKTVNVFDPNALPQIAISGSGTATAGESVTYTIPSPLPSCATFTGWTPISNATSPNWNSPTLSVYFHSAGTRTLTANFKMPAPDNRTFSSTKNVQVSLPSFSIDCPYAMYRGVPDSIYVVPPQGVTFTGWTPIPDATPSPNWNSPTLSLTFNNIGTYTLTANFSIGGVTFTRTNTINVYPVYPDIIGPTEVDSYSSAQYSLTPSPLPSYISFNGWRIVPLDPANQQTPMIYSPMNQTSSIYFNDVGEYYLIAEFYITGYGSYSTQKIVRSNLPFSYFYPQVQSENIGGGYMRVNVTNIPSSFANNYDIRYQWEVNGQIANYYSYQPIEVPNGTSVRFRVTLGSQTSPWGYP